MRKRKIHAGTVSHRLTACGLSPHRRYVAHPTSGANVYCQECLKALVDRLSYEDLHLNHTEEDLHLNHTEEDFRNYLAGGRVAIPIPTSEVP